MLTSDHLKELLHYDPDTGVFTWLKDRIAGKGNGYVRTPAGTVADAPHPDGYRQIKIEGVRYLSHRLAFFYMTGEWPTDDVDHIDLNRTNNRWENIRPATRSQNKFNTLVRADSKTGVKGVSFHHGKYRAMIMVEGERINLGIYDGVGEAAMSYALAAQELHGEYANTLDMDEILNLDWLPPIAAAA